MFSLYLFCLILGLPLLLWMAFAGDMDGGEGFGEGFGGDGDGGMTVIPLAAVAAALSTFGAIGLIGDLTDTSFAITLTVALVFSSLFGYGTHRIFKWLKAPGASSEVTDAELEGTIARVALPISTAHRGKVIVDMAGAREQMTASPVDGSTIEVGEPVVIVRVEGGVALVAPMSPDLELGH